MLHFPKILGQPINHPADLQSVDNGLYNGVVTWVLENNIDEYEMPFSINCKNPWDESRLEEVQLGKCNGLVTDKNKVGLNVISLRINKGGRTPIS